MALDAGWTRRSGRDFSRRDARAPIREDLLYGSFAEKIEFLMHRLSAREDSIPLFNRGIAARGDHAELMAVVAAVPLVSKPFFRGLVPGGEIAARRRLNQRRPIAGRIDLGRFLRSCGVGNFKRYLAAARRFDGL